MAPKLRATITVDPDVEAVLKEKQKELILTTGENQSFSKVVNAYLRKGLKA